MAEVTGKIKIIGELQSFASGFTKIQLVVTSDDQYPSDIPIEFLKDKSDLLQNFNVGDSVKVTVNIKGSEYQGKYYVALNAWKIEKTESAAQAPTFQPANDQNFEPISPGTDDDGIDLPF